jgi:hypothetical protein
VQGSRRNIVKTQSKANLRGFSIRTSKHTALASALTLLAAVWTASATVRYVDVNGTNATPPYTNWATAASVIQDAVDAADAGDEIVVANGIYATGGRAVVGTMTNRVAVDKPLILRSVNGPEVTLIQGSRAPSGWTGDGAIRCAYLTNGAVLSGFTLTSGATRRSGDLSRERSGAALWCESTNAVVTNCTLRGNAADNSGGAYGGTLANCMLSGNWAYSGAGAYSSTLKNCTLSGNSANYGGGAQNCVLNNCTLTGNGAGYGGGGTYSCTLNNCTLTGNSAGYGGGGAYSCTLNNCILYYNTAGSGSNYSGGMLNYCCTAPQPTNGIGNITNAPLFVDYAGGNLRLRPDSPCIDAGTNLLSLITTDLDGEFRPWDGTRDGVAAFDIGAYEFRPSPATLCVSLHNTNPVPPYSTWATAATNIQHAVDVAATGDEVIVSNGVYDGGLVVTNPVTLLSVNGPQFTIINGGRTNRCAYLTDGANLIGFTLTNGLADSGGGAYGGTLYDCTLSGNSAWSGGGAAGCTLFNCTLTGNSGAGARNCTLYNCTLSGNSAVYGGGASGCTLFNCIVYFNTDSGGANCDISSILNYCCTTPLPTYGIGNIAVDPLFVDYTGGNLRLQANSPCINAGNRAYGTTTTDLDGNPRIIGGTVDMGAYECQSPALLNYYNWLLTYKLSTSASAAYADSDSDSMNNWQEWVCGTCPTNTLSALHLLTPTFGGTNVTVSWQSVSGVNYFLEWNANLASSFTLAATNIIGRAGTTSYTHTNAAGAGPIFYRVGVKSP